MTTDREIRLTPMQMHHLDRLCRKRMGELTKKIDTAKERRLAGDTIQQGTLDAHYREREELQIVRDALEVARQQIVRQFKDKLGIPVEGERHGSS